ncbi:23622_t:CDS:2, partial [Gigaspora margarita]
TSADAVNGFKWRINLLQKKRKHTLTPELYSVIFLDQKKKRDASNTFEKQHAGVNASCKTLIIN